MPEHVEKLMYWNVLQVLLIFDYLRRNFTNQIPSPLNASSSYLKTGMKCQVKREGRQRRIVKKKKRTNESITTHRNS